MNKPIGQESLIHFSLVALALVMAGFAPVSSSAPLQADQKIYIAVEGDGDIAVFNAGEHTVSKRIDVARHVPRHVPYTPHNIQVAPDGKTVWATASVTRHGHGIPRSIRTAFGLGDKNRVGSNRVMQEGDPDEVIVIDPTTDGIIKRIALGVDLQLAHVVVTRDGAFAYVTGQKSGVIYKIDAQSYEVVKEIKAREGCEPHGLRIAPDGLVAYIALLKGKALGILDLRSDLLTEVPLSGQAVQAGVTPDGQYAFASLYDTKQLAVYHVLHRVVVYIALPAESKGPLQMYPTADSRYVYLADQGYYFEQPMGEFVYKVDLHSSAVVKAIKAGEAPHGVVVSPDGKFVYVTNLVGGDVSVIDTATDEEVARVPVGTDPNGISIWFRQSGGMP
ncbi:MAG: YncE family protein [Acidobacteria bacterium]|nr:YncE family protein [Acidobacteriota bacterium]